MEDEQRGFFLQFKETACHFLWQVSLCVSVCVCVSDWSDSLNANTQIHEHTEQDTRTDVHSNTCTLLPGDSWSQVVVSWPWGFGLGWVGLLILTVWPCLASCQCWASSCWLLWPPINQGQLLRWCTAASPPVAALPCRVQGGRGERQRSHILAFTPIISVAAFLSVSKFSHLFIPHVWN